MNAHRPAFYECLPGLWTITDKVPALARMGCLLCRLAFELPTQPGHLEQENSWEANNMGAAHGYGAAQGTPLQTYLHRLTGLGVSTL